VALAQAGWQATVLERAPAFGEVGAGVHRQRLHAVLPQAAEAAGAELITGAEVTGVSPGAPGGEPATVTWQASSGEHTRQAALVVAADGVRSTVRAQLFPDVRPCYAGSTSWRAVIPDSAFDGRLVEVWGPGTEFGALRVSDSEIYWYGEFLHAEGASFADELVAARGHFAGWAP
jgi:2-polyprenyl-6-methoxyphenol hydroxylase-like FAD-dependent oxidoreductase